MPLWLLLPEPFPAGGSSRTGRDVAPALPSPGGGTSGLFPEFWALLLCAKAAFESSRRGQQGGERPGGSAALLSACLIFAALLR